MNSEKIEKTRLNRRTLLLNHMSNLTEQDIHCRHCPGHCCTDIANSMRITPLEAYDLWNYLVENKPELISNLPTKIDENISRYRLDYPLPGNGQKDFLRRTYTCPFFAGNSLGCIIAPEHKPYGCLAFNPSVTMESLGTSCHSKIANLKEKAENESTLNEWVKDNFKISWETETIPVAMRDFLKFKRST